MRGLVGDSHTRTLVLLFDVVLAGNLELLALLRRNLFGQELHAGVFAGAHELVAFLLSCVLPAIGPGRAECSHLSMRVLTRWGLLFCFSERKNRGVRAF